MITFGVTIVGILIIHVVNIVVAVIVTIVTFIVTAYQLFACVRLKPL